ncbi:MAG: enolase C-terminal domain-like protein [Candidatus Latescibacterota bacterium]|nr:enolase C-terminal domain-like protein [Candidatus Latescibacterota bacterium]
MKITDVKLKILENPRIKVSTGHEIIPVSGLRRIQYTHRQRDPVDRVPSRQNFIEVYTDEGIMGRCTTTMTGHQVDIVRHHLVGRCPWDREALFQLFYKGTRWVYQPPGWFGDVDNCLWDILGKVADLPVYSLIGRVRNKLPVYLTGGDMDTRGYLKHIELGRECGIMAYKFHSYKGGKADIPIYQEVRREVGPEYVLITDPVCSYDLREAIEVGRVIEELDFIWLEEPMPEQKMDSYKKLCSELTIPVMGTEMLMHDMGLTSQWLIQGATDRLRGNARHGTTQVLKLAHLAELHNTNIELNGEGGLFGHVHANLGCCIDNTDYFEFFRGAYDGLRSLGQEWGMMNAPLVVDGSIMPENRPGWGAEWDEDKFNGLVIDIV